MKIKQQDKKLVKTKPVANLPVVTLTQKDMSAVSGGGGRWT
jgi:hypothetical protein